MLQVRTIKKLIFSLTILLVSINVQAQEKTIINVNSDREAVKLIFSNLTDSIYNYALLNRVFDKSKFVYEQVFDNYNTIYNALDWVEVYDNIALSYIDTSMFSVHKFVNDLTKYFAKVEEEFNEELIQPFGFILQNISQIDSVHFKNGDVAFEEGKLTLANIEENYLYNKVLIKSACNLEASTYPFYSTPLIGKLQYDERFIFISDDIELLSLEINVKDGKGFQEFGVNNPIIEYSREIDSLIATVQYSYLLNDSIYYDRVKFYINIKGVESSKFADGWDIIKYGVDPVPDNDLKYNVGILYGCGNVLSDGETPAIKRPIIISPPYRPPIQFYFFLQPWGGQNYFEQFDISLLFQRMSMMGYDVIFIKERPGNVSLETAGEELAQFIKNINVEKENNFPDEHWENVVMGYSAGGQKARYALMKLEKEHMTPGNYGLQGGPHHHTRLYIPFDSPHNGANVPMSTQVTYKYFYQNILANMGYNSLIDGASSDQGGQNIDGSSVYFQNGHKVIDVGPHPNYTAFQNNLESMTHSLSHTNDLRKKYPTFTRNIAISTGSYINDYNDEYGLTTGGLLYYRKKSAFLFSTEIKLWASKYSTTQHQNLLQYNSIYLAGSDFEYHSNLLYVTKHALELDNAQGGYKTVFYSGIVGAIGVLRSSSLPGLTTYNIQDIKFYDGEMNFLPLVSALGINPSIWNTNNVNGTGIMKYNLQDEKLFRIGIDQFGNYILTDNYGYPHLGYPSNHFNITPFEAVYADVHTYDHIVMRNTVDDYDNITNDDLDRMSKFILDEIEDDTVYLQNRDFTQIQFSSPYTTYEAWYKARKAILIGQNVTYKTDAGTYYVDNATLDLTAPEVIDLTNGTYFGPNSNVHIHNESTSDCDLIYTTFFTGKLENPNQNSEIDKGVVINTDSVYSSTESNKQNKITFYPNPNNGNFMFKINEANLNGNLNVYNMAGKLVYTTFITENNSALNLKLEKGVYLLNYQTKQTIFTSKIIIQ